MPYLLNFESYIEQTLIPAAVSSNKVDIVP